MELPRTFVSFSSTDEKHYAMTDAWRANEHIDFNFADFQIEEAIQSQDQYYIKSILRGRIRRSDTFILLIGTDTWQKTTFVKPEVEIALEKGCRLIGMNLNHCRFKDERCPDFFADKGALFIPFSSRIAALALKPWRRDPRAPGASDDWFFYDWGYTHLGYQLIGDRAVLPERPNPFAFGRPSWAK